MKVTVRDLKNSGILNDLFANIRLVAKKKAANNIFKVQVSRIIHNFNYLKTIDKFKDPARDYLKKLIKDYEQLGRIETHKSYVSNTRDLIGYEIQVCKAYLSLFRKKEKKESVKDLIFLDLADLLKGLKFEKRLEIIADLYIFLSNPPPSPKNWKSQYPLYYLKEFENVRKRLQRARKASSRIFGSKKYKEYEKHRMKEFHDSAKECLGVDKFIQRLLDSRPLLKKYIRTQYLKSHLLERSNKSRNKFYGFNVMELGGILRQLKIPKSDLLKVHRAILDDSEFLLAFTPNISNK